MKRYLTVRSIVALTIAVVAAGVVGFAASSEGDPASPVGQPPPEWAANTWPAHNHDLSNTRATSQSPSRKRIDPVSTDVGASTMTPRRR